MRLYCYDDIENVAEGDPHAVQMELDEDDVQAYNDQGEHEAQFRAGEIGSFVPVTDQSTGRRYMVAHAPCGLGCRCAAVAVRVAD